MRLRTHLLLLSAILAICPSRAAEVAAVKPKPDIVGWYYWELLNAPLQFLVKISRDASGRLQVTADNLARGEKDHPVAAVFYEAPNFLIEFDPVGCMKGRLSEDGSKLESVYQFGDFIFPSNWDRIEPSRFPPEPELIFQPGASGVATLGGIWNGTMDWKGAKLRHVVRIGRAADGSVRGKLDMLDQGERNIPLTAVKLTNSTVRFECKPYEIVYAGQLSSDGRKLEMNYESGTKAAPVSFELATEAWRFELPSLPAVGAATASARLEGVWRGIQDMQSTFARIELRIGRAADGSYRIVQRSLDDPDAIYSVAVAVDVKAPELKCDWLGSDLTRTVLTAKMDSRGDRLVGVWENWGSLNPISLVRQPAEAAKSQTGK